MNTPNTATDTRADAMVNSTAQARFGFAKVQLVALMLMIGGWGWTAGNFAQPQEPLAADALTDFIHALPLIFLVIFGWRYFTALFDAATGPTWAYVGIVVVAFFGAVLLTLGGLVLTLTGVSNSNPNSVGIHNLDDAIPAIIQLSGSLLWLVTALLARRQPAGEPKRASRPN